MYVDLVINGHHLQQNWDHFRAALPTKATCRCPTELSILIGLENREEGRNGPRPSKLGNAVAYKPADPHMRVAQKRKDQLQSSLRIHSKHGLASLAAGLFVPSEHRSQEREKYIRAHGSHLGDRLFAVVEPFEAGTAEPYQPCVELCSANGLHG